MMAYADFFAGSGAFTNLFASARDQQAPQDKTAPAQETLREHDRLDARSGQRSLPETILRLHFTG